MYLKVREAHRVSVYSGPDRTCLHGEGRDFLYQSRLVIRCPGWSHWFLVGVGLCTAR